jgi:hypothetical protein
LYRIDSGVDIGPQDLSEEVFNRECLRWVQIIFYPVFRIRIHIDFDRLDPDPRGQILRAEAEAAG